MIISCFLTLLSIAPYVHGATAPKPISFVKFNPQAAVRGDAALVAAFRLLAELYPDVDKRSIRDDAYDGMTHWRRQNCQKAIAGISKLQRGLECKGRLYDHFPSITDIVWEPEAKDVAQNVVMYFTKRFGKIFATLPTSSSSSSSSSTGLNIANWQERVARFTGGGCQIGEPNEDLLIISCGDNENLKGHIRVDDKDYYLSRAVMKIDEGDDANHYLSSFDVKEGVEVRLYGDRKTIPINIQFKGESTTVILRKHVKPTILVYCSERAIHNYNKPAYLSLPSAQISNIYSPLETIRAMLPGKMLDKYHQPSPELLMINDLKMKPLDTFDALLKFIPTSELDKWSSVLEHWTTIECSSCESKQVELGVQSFVTMTDPNISLFDSIYRQCTAPVKQEEVDMHCHSCTTLTTHQVSKKAVFSANEFLMVRLTEEESCYVEVPLRLAEPRTSFSLKAALCDEEIGGTVWLLLRGDWEGTRLKWLKKSPLGQLIVFTDRAVMPFKQPRLLIYSVLERS